MFGGAEELARLPVPPSCIYIDHIRGVCLCEQLFTCHAKPAKDKTQASPFDCGCYLPGIHQWRSSVGVCSQPWAWQPHGLFFKGVFVSDTCPVASWSSPRTFVQFYLLDATAPLVAPSVPSQQYTSALRRDSSLVVALPGCIM